jgi:L-2-hydroxyglutarate oxidase LhgO
MSTEVRIAIIGAGVIGLAIAAELARTESGVFVFEKNRTFGLETSSHNSEVIHAGIYYPRDTLKATLCTEGNRLLYEFAAEYNVPHRRTGKLIVAIDESELGQLDELYAKATANGVPGLRMLSAADVRKLEPRVTAAAGILSPSTGIIDGYGLMRALNGLARQRGADFVYDAEVNEITKTANGFRLTVNDRQGLSTFESALVINAAGLHADRIAGLAGIDVDAAGYRLHYNKGEYFSVDSADGAPVSRLVYPLPEHAGKGIHVSLNIDGGVRLGPNTRWVDEIDYSVDETERTAFHESVRRFLPGLRLDDLAPDFAGIRPKLQGPDDDFRDFVITDEASRGLPGLISLVGIESPGLTASPAIARQVATMARRVLG